MIYFSEINERIMQLIDFKANKNQKKFAEMIGFAPQVISNMVSGRKSKPSFDVLNAIISSFVDIDANWLLTGQGSMLKQGSQASSSQLQQNDNEIISLLRDKISLLESNNKLQQEKITYLEQRLELAELKDKEAMAIKIKKQRKALSEKDAIINLQNEEIKEIKSVSLPPNEPLQPSKRV